MEEYGFQNIEDVKKIRSGNLKPTEISEENRDYYLERRYPAFGNLVPRDVASRAAKERIDNGFGVNKTGEAVYQILLLQSKDTASSKQLLKEFKTLQKIRL